MAAGTELAPDGAVRRPARLRTGTAAEHEAVERTLDLLDPHLDRSRLTGVLTRMHGFWQAAEAGLDDWAARFPPTPRAVDLVRAAAGRTCSPPTCDALGAAPADAAPALPPVGGTDEALGRLYVLEGSTLGGAFIDRHLDGLPAPVRRPAARLLPLRRRDRRHVARASAG